MQMELVTIHCLRTPAQPQAADSSSISIVSKFTQNIIGLITVPNCFTPFKTGIKNNFTSIKNNFISHCLVALFKCKQTNVKEIHNVKQRLYKYEYMYTNTDILKHRRRETHSYYTIKTTTFFLSYKLFGGKVCQTFAVKHLLTLRDNRHGYVEKFRIKTVYGKI